MKIIKNLEQKGFVFLFLFLFQPIINFVNFNTINPTFSSLRTLIYFFIIIFLALVIINILDYVTKRKRTFFIFFSISLFIFLTFNFQLFHKSLLSSIYFITNEVITEKSIFYIFIAFSLLLIIVFSKIIIFRNVKIVLYIILSTIIFVDTFSLLKRSNLHDIAKNSLLLHIFISQYLISVFLISKLSI